MERLTREQLEELAKKPLTMDFHKFTVNNDIEFDIMMCQFFGLEWRWEVPFKKARYIAKTWNFNKLCSLPPWVVNASLR